MLKIAFISEYDQIFSLPAINKFMNLSSNYNYDIKGLWMCKSKLSYNVGLKIPLYYLKTFGLINFILLGIYSFKIKVKNLLSNNFKYINSLNK